MVQGITPDRSVFGLPQIHFLHVLGVVSSLTQPNGQRRRQLGINEEAHVTGLRFGQHEHGMVSPLRRVFQAGPNVLGLQVGKVREDFTFGHTGSQQVQHILDADAHPPDAGASAALLGVECNPIRVFHKHHSTG